MQIEVSESKFVELLVHAVNMLDGQGRGMATKLNKILYFCDFAHVRRSGDPITGFEYQKLPQGPAPRAMVPVRDRLIEDKTLSLQVTTDAFGYTHHILSASRDADMAVFSESERATIDDVISEIVEMSARQVSDLSHEDAAWHMAAVWEEIPYAAAYLGTDAEVPKRLQPDLERVASKMTAQLGHRLTR